MGPESLPQHLLLGALPAPTPHGESWVNSFIRARIFERSAALAPGATSPTPDVLSDIGLFLSRAVSLLSQVASDSVYGRHVDIYVEQVIQEMEERDDFSEFGPINDTAKRQRFFRCVVPARRLRRSRLHSAQTR